METWKRPTMTCYKLSELARFIKAKAWSVNSAMTVGDFLDQGNQGSVGMVYMDVGDNAGYAVQCEIISVVFAGIYCIKTILTQDGRRYTYRQAQGSHGWLLD